MDIPICIDPITSIIIISVFERKIIHVFFYFIPSSCWKPINVYFSACMMANNFTMTFVTDYPHLSYPVLVTFQRRSVNLVPELTSFILPIFVKVAK